MHEYYRKNAPKLKKAMDGLLKPIASELERRSGRSYADVFALIWEHYEKNMRLDLSRGDSAFLKKE